MEMETVPELQLGNSLYNMYTNALGNCSLSLKRHLLPPELLDKSFAPDFRIVTSARM